MMRSRFFALFAIILAIILVLPAAKTPVRAQTPTPDDAVAGLLARMSVEDKVGQLFVVPFVGDRADSDTDVWQLITEYKVGGIILLASNSNFNNDPSAPRQIAELTNTLKTTAFNTNGIPLFVAMDHEGDGYPYTRITQGVSPVPSQMAIGATWNPAAAEAVGQVVGEELAAMGINLLLGPSLDVLNDPRPTGRGDIGIRVFGGDPYWVGQIGRAYIRGVHRGSGGRLATVAKHFPGHGGSDRLPDNEVATVDKSLQELRRIELPPFFEATAAKPNDPLGVTDALMSSHIRYRGFQGDIRQFTAPISFDAGGMGTLTGLPEISPWRQQGGLIVSDALGVPAVRRHFDPSLETFPHRRIAKDAFLAGNDVLSLVQFDLKSIWSDQFANIKDTIFFFKTEYLNNPAFAARVDESVARILRLKLKLYPDVTLDALNNDPDLALQTARQPRPIIDDIARQSVTLLYPSPEELRLRLPEAPRTNEQILIVNDTRFARECFLESCQPKELFIPRNAVQDTILRQYGPGATGQIQPENISTITFSELKQALGGSLALPAGLPPDENPAIQLSAEEVTAKIQAADWIIFSTLDLNISRYPDSDALKLFLSQESGTLRDKKTVVLAFNAPYYLDTTEVTKLTAYYGMYSKTRPHIEAAVRALFGESDLPGASPVTVEGIGYSLADVLAPDPAQDIPLEMVAFAPENHVAPISTTLRAGPILDHNGHTVPDNTPVEFSAAIDNREISVEMAASQNGMAEATLILNEPGEIEISAAAGAALSGQPLLLAVMAPATATAPPVTPTPPPTPATGQTAQPNKTVTAIATASPTPAPTPTSAPSSPPEPPAEPPPVVATLPRQPGGLDLLAALVATALAGLIGFWLGGQRRQPPTRQMQAGLWVLIGGLLAYLLAATGWLRPELWFTESPSGAAARLALAGLVFVFGLAGLFIGRMTEKG